MTETQAMRQAMIQAAKEAVITAVEAMPVTMKAGAGHRNAMESMEL